MQDERRAMISTKATPMAEYQIDETSYKSIKMFVLIKTLKYKSNKCMHLIYNSIAMGLNSHLRWGFYQNSHLWVFGPSAIAPAPRGHHKIS